MIKLSQECILVTNYIIEKITKYNSGKKSFSEQVLLHTKKIQKLLYFCDVEYMKRNNGLSLFNDEYTAYPSGPVIDGVYYEYMSYSDYGPFPRRDLDTVQLTEEVKQLIDEVLDRIMGIDTNDLITASNIEGGPWHQVYDENDKTYCQIISKETIYSFYRNRDIISGEKEITLIKKAE